MRVRDLGGHAERSDGFAANPKALRGLRLFRHERGRRRAIVELSRGTVACAVCGSKERGTLERGDHHRVWRRLEALGSFLEVLLLVLHVVVFLAAAAATAVAVHLLAEVVAARHGAHELLHALHETFLAFTHHLSELGPHRVLHPHPFLAQRRLHRLLLLVALHGVLAVRENELHEAINLHLDQRGRLFKIAFDIVALVGGWAEVLEDAREPVHVVERLFERILGRLVPHRKVDLLGKLVEADRETSEERQDDVALLLLHALPLEPVERLAPHLAHHLAPLPECSHHARLLHKLDGAHHLGLKLSLLLDEFVPLVERPSNLALQHALHRPRELGLELLRLLNIVAPLREGELQASVEHALHHAHRPLPPARLRLLLHLEQLRDIFAPGIEGGKEPPFHHSAQGCVGGLLHLARLLERLLPSRKSLGEVAVHEALERLERRRLSFLLLALRLGPDIVPRGEGCSELAVLEALRHLHQNLALVLHLLPNLLPSRKGARDHAVHQPSQRPVHAVPVLRLLACSLARLLFRLERCSVSFRGEARSLLLDDGVPRVKRAPERTLREATHDRVRLLPQVFRFVHKFLPAHKG
mmetsp:Transcript_10503/g.34521  ORF Transcript_10503/g.34521 Transcript_10503/m.34521 type:complete len:586 (+) Transcript_10503:681-2438(+)